MPSFVRFATVPDLDLLEAIETAADALLIGTLMPGEWPPAATGASRAAQPGFLLVSAETPTGAPVGFAHVLEGDFGAHLEQLSVLPESGRRGHGRALVDAAKAEAKARGHAAMTLRTFADLPWNAPFYRSCGFAESEPSDEFHRRLASDEEPLGLPALGRRVQMTAQL